MNEQGRAYVEQLARKALAAKEAWLQGELVKLMGHPVHTEEEMMEAIIAHDLSLEDDPKGKPLNAKLLKGKQVISEFPGIQITLEGDKNQCQTTITPQS